MGCTAVQRKQFELETNSVDYFEWWRHDVERDSPTKLEEES